MSEEATEEVTEEVVEETNTEEVKEEKPKEEVKVSQADWREGITDPDRSKFAQKFNSVDDIVKTAIHFEKTASGSIKLPTKDSSEEDLAKFHRAIGVPENAEDYKIDLSEDSLEGLTKDELDPVIDQLKADLHEAKATPAVAQAAINSLVNQLAQTTKETNEEAQASVEKADTELRKQWGADYDQNKEYAKRGFKQFGSEKFLEILENIEHGGVKLSNHPEFVSIFSSIGRKMGEGGLQTIITPEESQSISEQIDELTAKAHDAQSTGDSAAANRLFKQRQKLSDSLWGSPS